ncbi:HMG-box domain-containing protein [Aspergillus clavatus NRRL 1]|uniref:HMG box protein n=1 Tax=Aspergillus clavatus (strain ATCC 1007 / CBS 513.65 / DSM 816 / NCTC 3887 / NRRL 1 / QM 1276 / 107) TaxID=344612 RepID=A1CIG4_ASPCL|nr:HMG box protein [Aspergillus clavatus NRRL 1]EAW10669.1 HMG box protein [Aspergillus clavatus NRRL 1]
MATAAVPSRFIQPPSPPQSTNGDPASEPCGMLNPMYSHPHTLGAASLSCSAEAAYSDFKPQAIGYATSPPPYYNLHHDYSRSLPMQHSMLAPGIQVNTPPPAADDGIVPSNLESTPPRWPSPSTLKRSPGKTRVAKTPRLRRRAKKASSRDAKPSLPGPLSELTKHMTHVPVRDMESWVHRPVEARHQEVAKKNGKVARPMNSFMLYRSAYAERTKEWFAQNNHQVVSEVAGDSWRIEPAQIREMYERLANIEKSNHLKAHPGYKFSPSKDKKKRTDAENEQLALNGAGHTSESSPAFLQVRAMSSSELDSSGWESRDSTPFDFPEHGLPTTTYYSSSWHTSHPSKDMLSPPKSTAYLQQPLHHGLMGAHVEDARFRNVGLEELQLTSSTALAGLPGAAHHDLLQPQTTLPPSTIGHNGQVDPQLLSFQSDSSSNPAYNHSHYAVWQEIPTNNCYLPVTSPLAISFPNGTTYHHGLGDGREVWGPTSHEAGLDGSGGEFEHWLNPHASGYSA